MIDSYAIATLQFPILTYYIHLAMSSREPQNSARRSRSPKNRHHKRSRSPNSHHHNHVSSNKRAKLSAPLGLPFQAPKLHKNDLETLRPMFELYLDIQKQKVLEELPDDEVKGRWKSFVGKWYISTCSLWGILPGL